jgi:hypothetical protein
MFHAIDLRHGDNHLSTPAIFLQYFSLKRREFVIMGLSVRQEKLARSCR